MDVTIIIITFTQSVDTTDKLKAHMCAVLPQRTNLCVYILIYKNAGVLPAYLIKVRWTDMF